MASYLVTGDGGPVLPNGIYRYAGIYNTKPYYQRGDSVFVLWWDSLVLYWQISIACGVDNPCYVSPTSVIEAIYSAVGVYTGNPVIAEHFEPPPGSHSLLGVGS